MARPIKYNWAAVDWSKTDAQIRAELGCGESVPHTMRKKLGIPPSQGGHKATYSFEGVDWNLNNAQIAKLIGCSYNLVYLERKKRGMPSAPRGRSGGYTLTAEQKSAIAAARKNKKWSRTVKKAIGAGVRKGAVNKVPFNTRLDAEVVAAFRRKAKAAGKPLSVATEEAMTRYAP